jgi:probable F420-dependent oxidoreductase
MHVGIKIPNWGALAGPEALVRTATAADERGFDSIWVSDHVAVPRAPLVEYPYSSSAKPPFEPDTAFVEAFVALAYVAAVTTRVQLATGVLVLPLRNAVLVAKQTSSLDVLARGRLVLGVGAGWLADEFTLLDVSFDDRGRGTDEAIRTMRQWWAQDDALVDGRRTPIAMAPPPVRGAAVPVLVGGHSRAALRRASTLGDGWYASNISTDEFAGLTSTVRAMPGGRELTIGARPGLVAPQEAAARVAAFAAAGADFVVLDAPYQDLDLAGAESWVHRTADALPSLGSGQPLAARDAPAGSEG